MALSGKGIKLTLKGEKRLQEKIKKGIIKLSDGKKLHARIGVNLLKIIDKGFRTQGIATTGKKWKGLSENTIYARRRKSSKILQDTGNLRRSFVMDFSEKQVKVGTALAFAEVHEKGGRKKYIIRPLRKKALAFPHPGSENKLKKHSIRRFNRLTGFVSKSVIHPKAKKRKMLPIKSIAQGIITKTYDNFIKQQLKLSGLI